MKSPLKSTTNANAASSLDEFSHCTKPSVPADIEDGLKTGPARIRTTLLTKPSIEFSSNGLNSDSDTSSHKLPDPVRKALRTGPYRIRKTSVVANKNHYLFGKKKQSKLTNSNLDHFKKNLAKKEANL
ncbi:hypothetical protein K7432_006251 [Basidiobolus ranarum]|uniref:Uncharacterized protein n=1 Tax=Basidiobolus ranarum TaxID=34480 RepID=A0ABR2WVA8_9FUNG